LSKEEMKISKKEIIILIALFSITIFLTAYTISAYNVASHIHELDGRLMWSHFQGGSFFPWPSYPDGILAPMMVPLNEFDTLYYQLFIKSWILAGITVFLWAFAVVFLYGFIVKKAE
jgi:hypothetical protein